MVETPKKIGSSSDIDDSALVVRVVAENKEGDEGSEKNKEEDEIFKGFLLDFAKDGHS